LLYTCIKLFWFQLSLDRTPHCFIQHRCCCRFFSSDHRWAVKRRCCTTVISAVGEQQKADSFVHK